MRIQWSYTDQAVLRLLHTYKMTLWQRWVRFHIFLVPVRPCLGLQKQMANFRKLAELPSSQLCLTRQLFFHDLLTGCQDWKRLLTLRVQLHGNGPLRCVRGISPYYLLLWRKTSFRSQRASRRGGSVQRGRQILTRRGIFEAAHH